MPCASGFKFNTAGKFKIVQVTDTHIRTKKPEYSQTSVEMLKKTLDAESPDLVIFTGDVVSDKPYKAGFDLIIEPVITRRIPFVILFGNHDEEQELTRAQMAELIHTYPFHAGNLRKVKNVKGYGNCILEIKDRQGKKNMAVLYCMDSHAYSPMKPAVDGYDWFSFDQVAWYRQKSAKYTAANKGVPLPALAFFHIPLPEYGAAATEKDAKLVGEQREKNHPAQINSGMFAAMLECGDVMGMFVGHDHANDYVYSHHGIALAYGRFSGSKTTYTKGTENGVRVIELTEGERGFNTWIRLGSGAVIFSAKFPEDFLPAKDE
ncbi:MAG: metallophosphoesterase family protein [Tannerella sp.]|nr:metallophosphoesterase family protein [Tannerella sp.]